MKRSIPLKRKTPMKRIRAKRALEMRVYRSMKEQWLRQHPYCQMPSETGAPTCMRRAVQLHHMKGRMGSLLCDTRFWMGVCMECHNYIETHKNVARQRKAILY
jgi:hypothetical protein